MIGNDVVDLDDPEVRREALHPRFDRRVFSASERRAIRENHVPDAMRWVLWAAKEAAYKLAKKLEPDVVFSPAAFSVRLDAALCGEVVHSSARFRVRVAREGRTIHAVATDTAEPIGPVVWGISRIGPGDDPGDAARRMAIAHLARLLGVRAVDLRVVRSGRRPLLERRGRPLPADLSLSHHGRLVAFACQESSALRTGGIDR